MNLVTRTKAIPVFSILFVSFWVSLIPKTSSAASPLPKSDHTDGAIVVGAGWSGLMAACRLKQKGIEVVLLEKRNEIGGIFKFSEDPEILTVMETTELTSSRHLTQISNYPYPPEFPDFPSHWQIASYLESYAKDCGLSDSIRFGSEVTQAKKGDDQWELTVLRKTSTGEESQLFTSKSLVIASGLHSKLAPIPEMYQSFKGELLVSAQIKHIKPERIRGKRVLMVGGSETASDQVQQFLPFAADLHWSIPNGQHFFKKRGKFVGDSYSTLFNNEITPYDSTSTGITTAWSPPTDGKPGMRWGCNWSTVGSINSLKGHHVPEWDNSIQFFHQFVNKNADILKYVHNGTIKAHGKIDKIIGKTVYFKAKNELGEPLTEEFDLIILGFGYQPKLDYLPEEYQDVTQAYNFVFAPNDPSLAFAGFIRPVITSMPLLSDMATRWIAGVWSGELHLPSSEIMRAEQKDYNDWLDAYFLGTTRRMRSLIEPTTHTVRMMKHLLTSERQDQLVARWGLSAMLWFKDFYQSGTKKLHLILDDNATEKEFEELWEETGTIWTKGPNRRVLLNFIIGGLSLASHGIDLFPESIQKTIYSSVDWGMGVLYSHDDSVYLSENPALRDEVIQYYNAKIVGPYNKIVYQAEEGAP